MERKDYDRILLDKFAGDFAPRSVVCDVGCGPGHITKYLFERGLDIFGIDISEKCMRARRKCDLR